MYIIPYCLFKMVDFQRQNDTSKRVALHHPNDTIQENCRWWPFKRDPPTNSSCTKSGCVCVCFLKVQRFKSLNEYIYIICVYTMEKVFLQCLCNSSPFFLWELPALSFFPRTRYSTKRPLQSKLRREALKLNGVIKQRLKDPFSVAEGGQEDLL